MINIALVGSSMGENSFGQLKSYIEFLSQFGNVSVLTLYTDAEFIQKSFNLLVLPGGADVDPSRYKMITSLFCGRPDPWLEYFDRSYLPQLVGKIPIFGICRGLQTLNVLLGGTLYQNIYHPFSSKSRDETVHEVYYVDNPKMSFEVNSLHHQAIRDLGKLKIELKSSSTKECRTTFIEAVSNRELHIQAVQWHPEELYDNYSIEAIKGLLEGSL